MLLILLVVYIKKMITQRDDQQNLFINFATEKKGEFNTEELINVLGAHTSTLRLKRFEESGEQFEATFNAVFPNIKSLSNCKDTILTKYPGCYLNYVEMENY